MNCPVEKKCCGCACVQSWIITLCFVALATAFCVMVYLFGHPPVRVDRTIIERHEFYHDDSCAPTPPGCECEDGEGCPCNVDPTVKDKECCRCKDCPADCKKNMVITITPEGNTPKPDPNPAKPAPGPGVKPEPKKPDNCPKG